MASLLDLFVNVKVSGTGTVAGELAGISSQAARTDKSVGSSMRSIGSSMSRVGRGMSLFVTAPIALAGAAAIKMGAQFDQALTNAVSVTGKTGAAAEQAKNQMNDLALTLGAKTAFSAKDAADAMYDLASSGWSVNEMQKGLNGIMALAAATQTDLADATGTVVSALAQFGLESQDSGHVADVFTAAINKSRLQMDDLSVAMRYVGPVASAMGWSIETTTSALALMSDAGIEGSTAGTSLRAALSQLANPVGQAKDALIAMGLSMDEVNPKTQSLEYILNTLKEHGLDANLAMKLFGREAAPAMLALEKAGVPAVAHLTNELINSGNTAERTAKMQLNTLAGAWQNLSGSLETAAIRFEQQVEPALKAIANGLVPVVNRISALNPVVKSVIIGFLAFAAALGPLLVVGGLLLQAWGTISLVFASTSVTLAGIVSVAIPVIAAVAALAAIGIVLYKNWGSVSPVLQRVGQAINRFLAPVRNLASVIKGFVTGNWTAKTSQQFNSLSPALQRTAIVISRVASVIRNGLTVALKFVRSQAQVLINWWRNNLPLIQKIGAQAFEGLRKLVGQSLLGLVKLIKGIWGGLVVFWRINNKQITTIAQSAWRIIKTVISTTIKVILGIIKTGMQLLSGDWKGAWKTIGNTVDVAAKGIMDVLRAFAKIMISVLKIAYNTIKELTESSWEAVKNYIGDKINAARNRVKEVINDLKDGLRSAWEDIKSGASDAWEAIKQAMQNPIETAYNNIKGFINNIIGIVNHVLKAFGKDPIPELGSGSGGGGQTPTSGQDRMNQQLGRHGANVRAFARGGVMMQPNTGGVSDGQRPYAVYGEGRGRPKRESYLVHGRRDNMPYAQSWADSVGMTLVPKNARAAGGRHFASGGSWYPKTAAVNSYVEGHWPVQGSTYPGHGADGDAMNSVDWMTGQGWGVKATGQFLERGNQIVSYLLDQQKTFTDYIIWQRKMWDSGGVGPYRGGGGYAAPSTVSGFHEDHVHWESLENNPGPHVMGGPGGLAALGPTLAEQMWNGGVTPPNGWKGAAISGFLQGLGPVGGLLSAAAGAFPGLSKLLPDKAPGMGQGVLAGAAQAFLGGTKGWIHDWIFDTFGGTSGAGGASPKGLTIGEALTSGGWPGNLTVPASGIVWRESRGNAHAQNPSGARGLMQIMPRTAQGVGADYSQLYDPVYNTRTGYSVYKQAGGFSPWVTSPGGDYTDRPVTGYDYGGLIKRDHLAKVHANELYMPLDRPHVERTAQTALGTAELRGEIAELRAALTDGGIRVKDYGRDAQHIIVSGAHNGGLRAMGSKDGKNITVATVSEVQRNDRLKGKVRN